jgi:chemotaxis protein MotB
MADESASKSPIIIKKINKGGHGHHGGAWKIAYADFVTAMMAFFLLLWLLNSVTQEQLEGISNYFAPVTASMSTSGSGDILGGKKKALRRTPRPETASPSICRRQKPAPVVKTIQRIQRNQSLRMKPKLKSFLKSVKRSSSKMPRSSLRLRLKASRN